MKKLSHSWFGFIVSALTVLSLIIIVGSKAGAMLLVAALESRAVPLSLPLDNRCQAIVVLGGGTERERYAAKLQRETGLPLMVSGVEAPAMVRKITKEFATPIQWVEKNSRTTEENAEFSARILKERGIRRILLVTNAGHMLRAQIIFRHNDLEVIAAPVIFSRHEPLSASDFLPSKEGLNRWRSARHELLGIAWFLVKSMI